MVQLARTPLKNMFARLFVVNTNNDIEADEVLSVLDDFADSVEFLPTPQPGSIRSFRIQGQQATVDPNTSITGDLTFLYQVSDPSQISGNLTISQDSVALSTAVDPNGSSIELTVNDIILAAGESTVFEISGTNTDTNPISATFTITARQPDDYIYSGVQSSSDPSTLDINSATIARAVFANPQSVVLPIFADNQYAVIAQRSTDPSITQVIIGGINQISAFTLHDGILTVNGVSYDVLITNNLLVGSVVSGVTMTIVR